MKIAENKAEKKEKIITKLKDNGCRITKQRLMLIDIILENECTSCKEIFFQASKADGNIGVATVYRMINALEEIGAINRRNMYQIQCPGECVEHRACTVYLDDGSKCCLPPEELSRVIREGLRCCGYLKDQTVSH